MNWKPFTHLEMMDGIIRASNQHPQVIFKHSTRCSISIMAKNRLDNADTRLGIDFHYLDLLAHRDVSNHVAELFQVHHESPQVLIIKNGSCIYVETHSAISMEDMIPHLVK